jgi:dCMP deaminase
MKQKYIDLYMDWAKRAAELSHARRLQVGAVIVKDDSVISYGYNGMPAGWDNNCEYEIYEDNGDDEPEVILKTKPEVLHAETNAIAKLARNGKHGLDSDLFITHAPCMDCAKLIYQAGIRRVWFGAHYRDSAGLDFLKAAGVTVEKVNNDT